ncbi:hypothetical protein [Pseudonocardia sp. GCM10023141]|uniref:hypothetical protein n=1 Tax=Pseudonocardia sp. GCM10023141 TaxID=3252653 RepID=UPI00361D58D0
MLAVARVLILAALRLSLLASVQPTIVLAVYVAVQLACCFWLGHQRVLDIYRRLGFPAPGDAGRTPTGIARSQWFLLMAGFD